MKLALFIGVIDYDFALILASCYATNSASLEVSTFIYSFFSSLELYDALFESSLTLISLRGEITLFLYYLLAESEEESLKSSEMTSST